MSSTTTRYKPTKKQIETTSLLGEGGSEGDGGVRRRRFRVARRERVDGEGTVRGALSYTGPDGEISVFCLVSAFAP